MQGVTAYDYLKGLPYLPTSREGRTWGRPSNAEIRRWLDKRAVEINGMRPGPTEEIQRPITSLVFFPKGHRVTML